MKTNYEKLFLIDPEIYHKMLPLMGEVEKRDTSSLNEQNDEAQEVGNESEKVGNENESEDSPKEVVDNADTSSDIPISSVDQPDKIDLQSTIVPNVNPENTSVLPKKRNQNPKRYFCEICVDKGFTTR